MKTRALVAGLGLLAAACEPSPESFNVVDRSGQFGIAASIPAAATLAEGDVLVVDTAPLDDDKDPMDLCVTATSSDTTAVEVRRVQGKCRMFVISAKASGSALVTLKARDGTQTVPITVNPVRVP